MSRSQLNPLLAEQYKSRLHRAGTNPPTITFLHPGSEEMDEIVYKTLQGKAIVGTHNFHGSTINSMLTNFRIIFPKDEDPIKWMQFGFEGGEAIAKVLFHNIWWRDGNPAFAPDMDIHVGIEQPDAEGIFGGKQSQPARGLFRGEYRRSERNVMHGGFIWLVFALRYDMEEGPEEWRDDRHLVIGENANAPKVRLKFTES